MGGIEKGSSARGKFEDLVPDIDIGYSLAD